VRLNWLRDIIRTVLLFVLILGAIGVLNRANTEILTGKPIAIDGDSLRLNGKEIRLLDIDAPEYTQTCKSLSDNAVYNCGRNAARHLRKMLSSNAVSCEGSEIDKYDRLLAICHAGDIEINRQMVSDGWAVSFGAYFKEEKQAEEAKRGLWAGEFQLPSAWRRDAKEARSVNWFSGLLNRLLGE